MRIVTVSCLLGLGACSQPSRPPARTQSPQPVPVSEAARPSSSSLSHTEPTEARPDLADEAFASLLHPDFQAVTFFRDQDSTAGEQALFMSARLDDGSGASCVKRDGVVRCIDFAGYASKHVGDLLRKGDRPAIVEPAWAKDVFRSAEALRDVAEVEVLTGDAGPLLMIHELDAVRFAFRVDRSWRVSSSSRSGGKSRRPFYFGSLDMSRATGRPSLGIVVGGYTKEGCVRSEVVELVVMAIEDAALTELGSVVIGRGDWLALDHRFAPFDPKDPNHYRIQLRPRVQQDGEVRFEIESRHTPKALRNRKQACGVDLDPREIDAVTKLVGIHPLASVLKTCADSDC